MINTRSYSRQCIKIDDESHFNKTDTLGKYKLLLV